MDEDNADLGYMDDPTFIVERRRVHNELSAVELADDKLRARYQAVEREFLRRARLAPAS